MKASKQYISWDRLPAVLTTGEVCILLQMTNDTVCRLVQKGIIPAKKIGRDYRFDKERLRKWIQGEEENTCSQPA